LTGLFISAFHYSRHPLRFPIRQNSSFHRNRPILGKTFDKGTHMGTVTIEDLRRALILITLAHVNGKINHIEIRNTSNCLHDFTKFLKLENKRLEQIEKMPGTDLDMPEVGLPRLLDLISAGNYSGANIEAKRIRAEMKPILQQSRYNVLLSSK
jgi:hypothetical protein